MPRRKKRPPIPPDRPFTEGEPADAWTVEDLAVPMPIDPATGKKLGRPRKEVSLEDIQNLSGLHCTDEEMGAFFRVSARTIRRRRTLDPAFKAACEAGQAEGKLSLRRKQFTRAVKDGNIEMLKFLGKNLLGQKEQASTQHHHTFSPAADPLLDKLKQIENEQAVAAAKAEEEKPE